MIEMLGVWRPIQGRAQILPVILYYETQDKNHPDDTFNHKPSWWKEALRSYSVEETTTNYAEIDIEDMLMKNVWQCKQEFQSEIRQWGNITDFISIMIIKLHVIFKEQ